MAIRPTRKLAAVLATCTALALVIFQIGAAEPPAAALPDEATLNQSLVKSAREVVRVLDERIGAGEPLTPAMVDVYANWSRRQCLAELNAEAERPARVKVAAAHHQRVTKFHQMLSERHRQGVDVSQIQVSQSEFYFVESLLWLARAKEGKPVPTF